MAANVRPAEATQGVPGQHGPLSEKQIKSYMYTYEDYNHNPCFQASPQTPLVMTAGSALAIRTQCFGSLGFCLSHSQPEQKGHPKSKTS